MEIKIKGIPIPDIVGIKLNDYGSIVIQSKNENLSGNLSRLGWDIATKTVKIPGGYIREYIVDDLSIDDIEGSGIKREETFDIIVKGISISNVTKIATSSFSDVVITREENLWAEAPDYSIVEKLEKAGLEVYSKKETNWPGLNCSYREYHLDGISLEEIKRE